MNRLRPGSISRFIAANARALRTAQHLLDELQVRVNVSIIPQIIPSASPRCTSIAPISVLNAQRRLRDFRRHAVARADLVVRLPVALVARIVFRIHDLEIDAGLQLRADLLEAHLDDRRPADDDRLRDLLEQHELRGTQHALVLALGNTMRASFFFAVANTGRITMPVR
jgi:hypothetical protein